MRALLALGFCLLAGPVLALSCVRPDVATTYKGAAEADETYVVVLGILEFNETLLPDFDGNNNNRPDRIIPARIKGKSLSRAGFETSFDRNVSLVLQCLGPWCGGAETGVEYLAFLERTQPGYIMRMDPCGFWSFSEPSRSQILQAESCMAGRTCEAHPF